MNARNQPSTNPSVSNHRTNPLVDNHGRTITYLRLAITDRCNLRCAYCMGEEGVDSVGHGQTLSYEELTRLVRWFVASGVTKVRITGGEPLVRRGCIDFMRILKEEVGVEELFLTTNGVETARFLPELVAMGLAGINLSLDTLDPGRFELITRRNYFDRVFLTLEESLQYGIPLKINSVVAAWTTDDEIRQLASLIKERNLTLRFIEHMPFSGKDGPFVPSSEGLLHRLQRLLPGMTELEQSTISTARLFWLPGARGTLGIIEGHSRKFCGSCNKVRITPQGMLKACLYDHGVLDLRALLRNGCSDSELGERVTHCLGNRFGDGRLAEQSCGHHTEPSMASIGG
ncbi:MAG: GTP 3',8-cyclase MoaA [Desulfobulbaceae bacterium]|nr:MAG: GTP 3',8-cyclase MoaA [Desulfobulbaceae bacterium]